MQDKKDKIEDNNIDNEFTNLYKVKKTKTNFSGFILLTMVTTVGVLLALGLSFSAIKLMDSNETINTLISSLTGDDNEDKYIITYVESTGDLDEFGRNIGSGSIYISNAIFSSAENGGSGEDQLVQEMVWETRLTYP